MEPSDSENKNRNDEFKGTHSFRLIDLLPRVDALLRLKDSVETSRLSGGLELLDEEEVEEEVEDDHIYIEWRNDSEEESIDEDFEDFGINITDGRMHAGEEWVHYFEPSDALMLHSAYSLEILHRLVAFDNCIPVVHGDRDRRRLEGSTSWQCAINTHNIRPARVGNPADVPDLVHSDLYRLHEIINAESVYVGSHWIRQWMHQIPLNNRREIDLRMSQKPLLICLQEPFLIDDYYYEYCPEIVTAMQDKLNELNLREEFFDIAYLCVKGIFTGKNSIELFGDIEFDLDIEEFSSYEAYSRAFEQLESLLEHGLGESNISVSLPRDHRMEAFISFEWAVREQLTYSVIGHQLPWNWKSKSVGKNGAFVRILGAPYDPCWPGRSTPEFPAEISPGALPWQLPDTHPYSVELPIYPVDDDPNELDIILSTFEPDHFRNN